MRARVNKKVQCNIHDKGVKEQTVTKLGKTISTNCCSSSEKMITLEQSPYDARIVSQNYSKDSESQQDTKICMVSAGIYSDYAPTTDNNVKADAGSRGGGNYQAADVGSEKVRSRPTSLRTD